MNRIEGSLKADKFDQLAISEEMELCQERMNSLETMCNYLTSSLQSVQGTESAATIPDFRSEITLYGNAMEQLKSNVYLRLAGIGILLGFYKIALLEQLKTVGQALAMKHANEE
ncbi:hypothetical protein ANCDUO_22044 [Ancylostoma duodenale]|uniref:Uncharacterized protein n=1 Tax=Ancylostoma duodenale TaxID=51022 RepID=A0A0C2FSM9_9BILA|nr:hypothetical protein ANCDUO_22044 [Ancylostoma duodenale]